MKYKVGDKVRVRKDLEEWKQYGYLTFTESMGKLRGNNVTIAKVLSDSYLIVEDTGNFHWTEEMLESNKIIKKSDLQNGDIVTYRSGEKRIVNAKRNGLARIRNFDDIWLSLDNYEEDLFDYDDKEGDLDVVKVYRPETEETFYTERTKKTKKMTVAEICKELGYDVEIIKENE